MFHGARINPIMRSRDLNRFALSVCVGIVVLAGCGGSQPPIGALARKLSSSGQPLLYAFGSYGSGNAKILDYPSGTLVSEFAPKPSKFGGTRSDSEGNVFLGGIDASSNDPAIQNICTALRRLLNTPWLQGMATSLDVPSIQQLATLQWLWTRRRVQLLCLRRSFKERLQSMIPRYPRFCRRAMTTAATYSY